MALLNAIVSKFTLTLNTPQEVYVCPPGKSHAIVDISFLKDSFEDFSIVAIALTTESNPAALNTLDYFIDDIELTNTVNSAELNKIIIGTGERIIVKVIEGENTVVRVSGVEENNSKVLKAGKLAAIKVASVNQTQIYANALPAVAYVSTSITVYNPSTTTESDVEVWISNQVTPTDNDKVMRFKVAAGDTTIIENTLMLGTEKIFVKSNIAEMEYFLVGMVIGV